MIQGSSRFIYRLDKFQSISELPVDHLKGRLVFLSCKYKDALQENSMENESKRMTYSLLEDELQIDAADRSLDYRVSINALHVDVNLVDGITLNIEQLKTWKPEFNDAVFLLEDGKYICGVETEKMSKSKYNTVNPDVLVEKYGADTFRMYEMFLGPVEQSKPWDSKGIEGVHRFLRKLWRLFNDDIKGKIWNEEKATSVEIKVLHKTIKKIENDTEQFSFNTAVSAFMVAVNELSELKCNKREMLEPLLILLVPYAPHIAEELWQQLGNSTSILDASFPEYDEKHLVETTKEYPVSVNGKLRTAINLSLDATTSEVEEFILANDVVQKWLEGKQPKKIIFVKGKMINVVI